MKAINADQYTNSKYGKYKVVFSLLVKIANMCSYM